MFTEATHCTGEEEGGRHRNPGHKSTSYEGAHNDDNSITAIDQPDSEDDNVTFPTTTDTAVDDDGTSTKHDSVTDSSPPRRRDTSARKSVEWRSKAKIEAVRRERLAQRNATGRKGAGPEVRCGVDVPDEMSSGEYQNTAECKPALFVCLDS